MKYKVGDWVEIIPWEEIKRLPSRRRDSSSFYFSGTYWGKADENDLKRLGTRIVQLTDVNSRDKVLYSTAHLGGIPIEVVRPPLRHYLEQIKEELR